jgi:SAM-dependent methyltransferase
VDPERLRDFSRRLFGHLNGAVTSALVYLGDELGLYRALAEGGPANSAELAERTGLDERWVREWLYNQGAARLIEAGPEERFSLTPEARVVLAEEAHPAFGAGMFSQLPKTLGAAEQLRESFRSGLGLPYDAFGPEGARGVERVLAEAFPQAQLHGYELSRFALARAEENRAAAGATNLHFHHVENEPLPDDARFELMLSFDCLHDMTDPAGMARSIRRAIRRDGVWLIADIKAHPTYAENVAENPMASLMYGFSVLTCMSSALSKPGGAGLGTLGLPEASAKALCEAAGFSRFARLDVDHPINAFYEVRP